MKKDEAISILATSARPREPKNRTRYDEAVKMAIEALRQPEPCGEMVSREVVVKFFDDWMSALDINCHHQSVADLRIIKGDIKNLPSAQPEQRWIPVTERLPEENEYVLLCNRELEPDEEAGYSRMAVGWLEDGKFCCWDDRVARKEFVAWMPLPKPYKEKMNEKR